MVVEMRRKDRELSCEEAAEILANGKYGVLATVDESGLPYCVPLHYVVIDGDVWFHGTIEEGYKAACFAYNSKACFAVVDSEDGIKARSALVFGSVEAMPDMRAAALEGLVEKFVPPFAWEEAKAGIQYTYNDIMAYRLTCDVMTAKRVDRPNNKQ
ncbi:MAG: pyridoxamine 5'-phosphate oxidase family protein [Coriobacteriales bacterium]|jgi:nitroimidazol reductase NimA-like FMN-containing flavoprotein (pyridoxamine 5'-phosphate oxidase superfamily)|nr:pyridoxamine 5'-phosphate oxidase family protein [Coriobacteriales bacterium]